MLVFKKIIVKEKQIEISIKLTLEKNPGMEDALNNILEKLYVGIDLPFFFNGDRKTFQWETNNSISEVIAKKTLMEPFQYKGSHFKAYDEICDLNFELMISSFSSEIKINKFPIVAYVFTDEGYKKIYQGINIIPQFKLDKTFEIQLKLMIY